MLGQRRTRDRPEGKGGEPARRHLRAHRAPAPCEAPVRNDTGTLPRLHGSRAAKNASQKVTSTIDCGRSPPACVPGRPGSLLARASRARCVSREQPPACNIPDSAQGPAHRDVSSSIRGSVRHRMGSGGPAITTSRGPLPLKHALGPVRWVRKRQVSRPGRLGYQAPSGAIRGPPPYPLRSPDP